LFFILVHDGDASLIAEMPVALPNERPFALPAMHSHAKLTAQLHILNDYILSQTITLIACTVFSKPHGYWLASAACG
jgi:hypothetical protein